MADTDEDKQWNIQRYFLDAADQVGDNGDDDANKNLLVFLTQKMKNIGLLPFGADDLTEDDVKVLIHSTLDLLRLHQKLTDAYDDLRNRYLRATNDLTCAQKCNARLKEVAEQREKIVRNLQENQSIFSREKAALNKKIKSTQDEIKHMISVAQSCEAQHRNEGRKKEVEINKLKDRLHALLDARAPASRPTGVDLSSFVVRQNASRRKLRIVQNEATQEEDAPKSLRDRQRATVSENEQLRRILSDVYQQMREAIVEIGLASSSSSSWQHENRCKTGANDDGFKLPLNESACAQIEEDFRLMLAQIKDTSQSTTAHSGDFLGGN